MQVLYGRHHVRVFRFGLRLVRNEQAAEDLISEVFLDVWRQAGKFEGRSAVSTWLLAITRFKALSALRRRKDVELDRRSRQRDRGYVRRSGSGRAEEGYQRSVAQVSDRTFPGTPGGRRSCLLPREIRGRGG